VGANIVDFMGLRNNYQHVSVYRTEFKPLLFREP